MSRSFTILEWPLLVPGGTPEVAPPPPQPEPVTPPRVAIPVEVAADDPRYAMLFPRVKRPTPAERS